MKRHKRHILHKENCQSKVRKSYIKKNGTVISLLGRHGFEWSVAIGNTQCFLAIIVFPEGREKALQEYHKLCKE